MSEFKLMTSEEHTRYMIRLVLSDPNLSPQILHEATDLNLDICIEICSHMLAGNMFGFADEKFIRPISDKDTRPV